jgi:hypothetical protein
VSSHWLYAQVDDVFAWYLTRVHEGFIRMRTAKYYSALKDCLIDDLVAHALPRFAMPPDQFIFLTHRTLPLLLLAYFFSMYSYTCS